MAKKAKAPGSSPTTQNARAPQVFRATAHKKPKEDKRKNGAQYFEGSYAPDDEAESTLHDRFRGAFMWSAYGDACGMPYEQRTPLEIYDKNGGWVTGLVKPTNLHGVYLDLGGWTDDTQLKLAIMNSILKQGRLDMVDVGRAHVRMYQLGPRGWGSSTRDSVRKLQAGMSWQMSGKEGGAGNGIPMKVGVIGALYGLAYSEELLRDEWRTDEWNLYQKLAVDVRNIAVMTHKDTRAIVAGVVHAVLMAWALNGVDPLDKWDELMRMVRVLEGVFPKTDMSMSSRLAHIEPNLHRDVEFFAHLYRTGCFVVESYPFSVATYLLYRERVHDAVLAAVNAGGDCDSTAAMVGELCGAEAGLLDGTLTRPLEEHDKLLGTADAYYHFSRHEYA